MKCLKDKNYKTIRQISEAPGFLKRTIRGYLNDLTKQKIVERRISNGVSQWKLIASDQKIEGLFDDSPIEYPWNEDPNFPLIDKIKPLRNRS